MKRNELIGVLDESIALGLRTKLIFKKLGFAKCILTNEFQNFVEMVKLEKPSLLVVDLPLIMKETDSLLKDYNIPTICMTYAQLPEEMEYCMNLRSAIAYSQKPINQFFANCISNKVKFKSDSNPKTLMTNFHLPSKLSLEKYNNRL